jgi:WD40 repeat protein
MNPTFDVFLSHNSQDKPLVTRIADKLNSVGIQPWFDRSALEPGGAWVQELERGLLASRSCAICVGPSGMGDWERLESAVALDRMAKQPDYRAFYVLLPGIPDPFDATSLPVFLRVARSWVDLRKGINDPEAFQSLVNAIKGGPPPDVVPPETVQGVCPYQGLQTFDEDHADFFFGRDADIQRLLEALKATRFLGVLGPSGSGKSSLVRAGLIPALRRGQLPNSDSWIVRVVKPGARPLEELSARLADLCPGAKMHELLDQLSARPESLHLQSCRARAHQGGERVLWVIDQFEEVFTLCRDEHARAQFILNLLYAGSISDGCTTVVLTMRADFYHKCAQYPEFASHLAQHQYLVSPIDAEGLRDVIEQPARRVGLSFETGLVETILEDVVGQPGALPLLEHALLELWKRPHATMLTLAAYRETGGVQEAIAKRADAIYVNFDSEHQQILRRVMLRLTELGEGTEDTRRRARLSELVTEPAAEPAVARVVKELSDARLLTTSGDDGANDPVVDVSHEALIRSWPRLRTWIEYNRAGLRVQQRLAEAAREWEREKRDESLLYRGARLAVAEEYMERHPDELNRLECDFVGASVALRDREQRLKEESRKKQIRLITMGSVVALVLLTTTMWFFLQGRFAQKDAELQRLASYWNKGIEERDRNNDPIKASHYFMRIAQADAAQREKARVASAFLDGNIRLVNISGPLMLEDFQFDPASKRLFAWEKDGAVRFWNIDDGDWQLLLGPTHSIAGASLSHGGHILLKWDRTAAGEIWDMDSKSLIGRIAARGAILGAEFGPDDSQIVTWTKAGFAQVWDARTAQERAAAVETEEQAPVQRLEHIDTHRVLVRLPSTVQLWNVDAGRLTPIAGGGKASIAVLSEDRSRLLLMSDAGAVTVLDTRTMAAVSKPWSFPALSSQAVFSPDAGSVAVWGKRGKTTYFTYWNYSSELPPRELAQLEGEINGASFSSDGLRVIAWGDDGKVRGWPLNGEGSSNGSIIGEHTSKVLNAAWSHDGQRIVAWTENGTVQVWASRALQPLTPPLKHGDGLLLAEFSADGKSIVTLTQNGVARQWNIQANGAIALPILHEGQVVEAAFIYGTEQIVSISNKGEDSEMEARLSDGAGMSVGSISLGRIKGSARISPDGRRLVTWDDAIATIWDTLGSASRVDLKHDGAVAGLQFSEDGDWLLTWTEDGMAQMWDTRRGRVVARLPQYKDRILGAALAAGNTRILVWTSSGVAEVWSYEDAAGPLKLAALPKGRPIKGAVFNHDATRILFWRSGELLSEWTYSGQAGIASLPIDTAVDGARYGPRDRLILLWTENIPRIFDREAKNLVTVQSLHRQKVRGGMFSTTGDWVLTWSEDAARAWDPKDGKPLIASLPHQGAVRGASASADGQRILTWGSDRTARLWSLRVTGMPGRDALDSEHRVRTGSFLNRAEELNLLSRAQWDELRSRKTAQRHMLTLPP